MNHSPGSFCHKNEDKMTVVKKQKKQAVELLLSSQGYKTYFKDGCVKTLE